jgi:UDP-N-acetylglucosamine--N-acetylmuramyl-(pentapeptide) pyrophosphoryl-undecaprenol N-acetylglucosamine transferase
LPTAADDHQRRNAEALAAAGAAELLEQSEMTGATLADRIIGLVIDSGRRAAMSGAALALAKPNAANAIVDRAFELIGRMEQP